MKLRYFLMISIVSTILLTMEVLAQSHDLVVDWDDGSGNIVQDALYNKVMGDTAVDGTRLDPDRVYVLKTGGYYWNYQTIENNFPLRIVGQTPSPTTQPAILESVTDIGSGGDPGKLISCKNDLILKNVYVIGHTELGVQSEYQQIEVNAVGKRFEIDNCIFDRSDFSILAWAGGRDNDIFITNCHFRNLIEKPTTQQWTGRGVSIWTDADTVIFENNTFFNVNMCAIQIENGAANYLRFNHNTLVNIGRAFHSTTNNWWREAYFGNLLMINVFWHGEAACDYRSDFAPNRDPRAITTGMFNINPMPSRYGTNKGRRIVFANSRAYLDDYFSSKYADTIRVQPFINAVTDSFFTTYSNANGGQMAMLDSAWLSDYPNFTSNPNTPTQLDAMYNAITTSRSYQYYGGQTQPMPYYYGLRVEGSDTLWADIVWPLPEDFTYTDAALLTAGTDGLPLGNLNYFPSAKAEFEANKPGYIWSLERLAGPKIVETVGFEEQAELGTPGGTAAVVPFTGPSWYTLTGGSNIEWTFNSTYDGPLDMKINARPDGSNIGFDFILNNVHLVDVARGWGQFVFWTGPETPTTFWTGKSTSQFYEATYLNADITPAADFKAVSGQNTLKLQYSWNNVSFARVDLYQAGTTNLVASLVPSSAVNNGATPGGEGVWVPLGFNSVALGSNGYVDFSINLASGGNSKVRVFYQNPGATQSGSVLVDGSQVTTLSFAGDPDSVGLDIISDLFQLPAGPHTLRIAGSGVNFDWLQIISETLNSINELPEIPNGFALSQNYPNPFNPSTKIRFDIGTPSNVKLYIYDILGQRVATLVNQYMNSGAYIVDFNAVNFASGVYFYSLEAGDFKVNKKMILLK